MRGKNDATTYPDKPVSWIASLFRGLMKEYSCDYRLYTKEIYIMRGKLKTLKFSCCVATLCFCVGMKIRVRYAYLVMRGRVGKLSGIFLLGRGCTFYCGGWVVQIPKKQTTPKFYLLRHRGILSIHQPRPSQQSTWLRIHIWQHHHGGTEHHNPR